MQKSKTPWQWDCGDERHEKCLNKQDVVECRFPPRGPSFTLKSRADLERAIEVVRANNPELSEVAVCVQMGVCAMPLVDTFSLEVLRLHAAVKNGAEPWTGGYYAWPAVYIEAAGILDGEAARLEAERRRRVEQ